MAQTLRESLTPNSSPSPQRKPGAGLQNAGAADWTRCPPDPTGRRESAGAAAARPEQPGRYPAIPLRDLCRPDRDLPDLRRAAEDHAGARLAFERQREVVLAVQKDAAIDDPTGERLL